MLVDDEATLDLCPLTSLLAWLEADALAKIGRPWIILEIRICLMFWGALSGLVSSSL